MDSPDTWCNGVAEARQCGHSLRRIHLNFTSCCGANQMKELGDPVLDRKRPVWPMVAAALVVFPVLYFLSYGPAIWLYVHCYNDYPWVSSISRVVYWPLDLVLRF